MLKEVSKMENGQSKDTDNIGYARHRAKTNKTKNTTPEIKQMSFVAYVF